MKSWCNLGQIQILAPWPHAPAETPLDDDIAFDCIALEVLGSGLWTIAQDSQVLTQTAAENWTKYLSTASPAFSLR